jgi:hypothetical protein
MIYEALSTVVAEMNEQVGGKLGLFEERVLLSSLVNLDGSIPPGIENKVVATLVSVQQEGLLGSHVPTSFSSQVAYNKQPMKLNLYVMFTACFEEGNYEEALKFLSYVMSFFQQKNLFTPQNSNLDDRVRQLNFEIAKLSFMEMSNIWAYLGAKYAPSVVYLVRYITLEDDNIEGLGSAVRGMGSLLK